MDMSLVSRGNFLLRMKLMPALSFFQVSCREDM